VSALPLTDGVDVDWLAAVRLAWVSVSVRLESLMVMGAKTF
jgi:hypothetical protein